jgi:Tol biopolymer transport system component
VYAPGGDVAEASLTWVNPSGEAQDIGLPPKRYGEFQLSPDGKTLAVVIYNGALRDLWALDLERNVLTRLTDDGRLWSPFWSPDGKSIVYAASSSGSPHLIELTLDGLKKRDIIYLPDLGAFNGFSPDGRVLFTTNEGGETVVSSMSIGSGERHEIFRSPYMIAFQTVSPDGHWLAYVSDETGRWEIYVRPMQGDAATARITTDGGAEPVWDKTGHRIYFRNGVRWMRAYLSTSPVLKAAGPIEMLRGPYVNIPRYSYNVAHDDRFLLLKSEYQRKPSPQLEIVENWRALLH